MRLRLGTKFILTVAVILAATMAANTVQYLSKMSSFHEQQLVKRGKALGDLIALVSPEAILGFNFLLLNQYTRVVSSQPDVVYSVIVNQQGMPLTSYVDPSDPFIKRYTSGDGIDDMAKLLKKLENRPELIKLEFPIIHNDKPLGRFVVGVSREQLHAQFQQQLIIQILIFTGIILFLSIAIYSVFRFNVLFPIQQLIAASRDVGRGQYKLVDVKSRDELGLLANAFNAMTQEVKAEQAKLYRQANFDVLTNLPNRMVAIDRIDMEINRVKRTNQRVAVLFIDLDDFKIVNDTLGHAAGDQLLITIGARLQTVLRDVDTVARLGGDEFLVLLPGADGEVAVKTVVQRLLKAVSEPVLLGGRKVVTHCSIGIALYPENGQSAQDLMANADNAMYQAKNTEQSSFSFFTAEMNTRLHARLQMEQDLNVAMEQGQLVPYFQPIVDVSGQRHQGAEVLLRWHHPERGFISPTEFIPLAETTGQIVEIGDWVLAEACRLWSTWHQAGLNPGFLSINISRVQFRKGLSETIGELMRRYNIPPHILDLEITESVLLDDHIRLAEELDSLRAKGVRLSLDDFGTGYSSLSYLKRFPFDVLKIDRSFITGLPTDSDDVALVKTILAMAHALDLQVVAEGVESREQLDFIGAHGCDYAQGYLFAKPMSETTYVSFLQKQREARQPPRTYRNLKNGLSS
jgi:diguanylate cyclase